MANLHVLSHIETGRQPHWRAAVWSGVIGAVVFLVLEMLMVAVFAGASPWGPVRMIGAIVMGTDALPPPATFSLGITIAALFVHFILGIVYGLLFSYILFRLEEGWAVVGGAVLGLLLFWINFYGFTALFPWFAEARNWITVFAHVVFGAVVGWSYKELARREISHERRPV